MPGLHFSLKTVFSRLPVLKNYELVPPSGRYKATSVTTTESTGGTKGRKEFSAPCCGVLGCPVTTLLRNSGGQLCAELQGAVWKKNGNETGDNRSSAALTRYGLAMLKDCG